MTRTGRALASGGLAALCAYAPLWAGRRPVETRTHSIPAFARKYRTSCSTCHTAAPKLNVLGEAFRLNGYRLPENDALLRRDEAIPLGADPWKDLWPHAIWPGEIPGTVPLALRIQSDIQVTRERGTAYSWTYRLPHEVYLLAGATLGEHIASFVEAEWSREQGTQVIQAKLKFQELLPWLPARSLNLWLGLQNLYLFTFADRQIDRAARQAFLWQQFRVADLELRNPTTGEQLRSTNEFELRGTQPAVELNGLAGGRLYYGFGLAQGAGSATADNNNAKDAYYKLRYKLGGLALDGTYAKGGGPVLRGQGQLLDRSLIVEHFGYFGAEPVDGNRQDTHRAFGVNARALYGPLDVGVGWVWGRDENPWGATADGAVRFLSLFGKAEYLVFPWLIASFKADELDVNPPGSVRARGFTEGGLDQSRVLPGLVFLVRQNIRGVLEAEFFTRHAPSADLGRPPPDNLWFRLDVSF